MNTAVDVARGSPRTLGDVEQGMLASEIRLVNIYFERLSSVEKR